MSRKSSNDPKQELKIKKSRNKESLTGQAGRDLSQNQFSNNTFNIFKNQESSCPNYQHCQVLINEVERFLKTRILNNQQLIVLDLEERLDAVTYAWNTELQSLDTTPKLLLQGTKIIDFFVNLGAGRTLLILGESGSGKTTALLELTGELLTRTKDVIHPIPVFFYLSTWIDKNIKIEDWLIEKLQTEYNIPTKTGKFLIEKEKLILLLDSLDEVKPEFQKSCLEALKVFHQNNRSEIVISSRIRNYESLYKSLNFQSAICLRSLTLDKINEYINLNQEGDDLIALKTLIEEDKVMQELANSPLILYMMVQAYRELPPEELPKDGVLEKRQKRLFNDYIEKMFKRKGLSRAYSKEQVIRWLIWLAKGMEKNNEKFFSFEIIQPNWIENKLYRYLYRLSVMLIVIGLLIFSFWNSNMDFIEYGIFVGILFGVTGGIAPKIEPVEVLSWSFKRTKLWIIIVLIATLLTGLLAVWIHGITDGVIIGITFVFFFSLFSGYLSGLRGSNINIKFKNNLYQGIWKSFQNSLTVTFIASILFIPPFVITSPFLDKTDELGNFLMLGISCGLIPGMLFGGLTCIQYLVLYLILVLEKSIPLNPRKFIRFLKYADRLIFLRKVGCHYEFIHSSLRKHFAQMS